MLVYNDYTRVYSDANWYVVWYYNADNKVSWTEEIMCLDNQDPLDYVTDFVKSRLIRVDRVR